MRSITVKTKQARYILENPHHRVLVLLGNRYACKNYMYKVIDDIYPLQQAGLACKINAVNMRVTMPEGGFMRFDYVDRFSNWGRFQDLQFHKIFFPEGDSVPPAIMRYILSKQRLIK